MGSDIVEYNPLGEIKSSVLAIARREARKRGLDESIELRRAPRNLGDYSLSLIRATTNAKELGMLGEAIAEALKREVRLVSRTNLVGGFLNLSVDAIELARLVFKAVGKLGDMYGFNPSKRPRRVVVEFLSANPIHPLHIGHLRNALLGESLSRLLSLRGHKVRKHFYINDAGLQVSMAAYGFSKLSASVKEGYKPDEYVGLVYSCVNVLLTIRELKRQLEGVKGSGSVTGLTSKLDEWVALAAKLRDKDPELFDRLAKALSEEEDPHLMVTELNRRFERGEGGAVKLIRHMCELVIEGFKETLKKLDVSFDSWDWESEVALWSGLTEEVISRLKLTGYVEVEDGSLVLNGDKILRELDLYDELGVSKGRSIPPLTLTRSDGTTLYPVRDVAYSIWKFKKDRADIVINVIGVEQTLPQLYVRMALWLLGYKREAKNLVHYAYEAVKIPGYKMSARKGLFVSVDHLIEEARKRALFEMEKRGLKYPEGEKEGIANAVGLGAVKYAILSIAPNKVINFDWDRALDFNQNSGPFIQYAYVRASSILKKAKEHPPENFKPAIEDELERELLIELGEWPEVVAKAADTLRVDLVALYASNLAKLFNVFYEKLPVLKAEGRELMFTRLNLVRGVKVVLGNALRVLGIEAPERM